jgi:proline racemase
MNCQLALYRIDALLQIIPNENNNNQSNRDKQHTLARLALAEVNDALSVLSAVSELGSTAQSSLVTAQAALQDAATDNSPTHRTNDATSARLAVQRADVNLGTGMVFVMGQGSLMF